MLLLNMAPRALLVLCIMMVLSNLSLCSLILRPPVQEYLYAEVGTEIEIECRYIGNGDGDFSWTGPAIMSGGDRVETIAGHSPTGHPNSVLRIREVDVGDAGTYRCRHSASNDEEQIKVNVTAPPMIKLAPSPQVFVEGTDALVLCVVDLGMPQGHILWYKVGRSLEYSDRIFVNGQSGLQINSIDDDDEGEYACIVERLGWGSTQEVITVTVTSPGCEAPRIDRTSMSAYLSVLFNESLDITCLLRPDSGSAEIWWTTPTGGIVRQPHLHVDPPCNPGGYLCVANSLELCGSDNYAVAVNVLLIYIAIQPQDQTNVVPGTNITFTIVAIGSDLNYQWIKDGESLTEGNKFISTMTPTLTVIDVTDSDEGGYRCIVGNAVETVLSMEAVLNTFCTDGEPRLVGGLNEIEGTVEICYNQTYWTVCDDHWDEMDSSIVCRQLGYNAEGSVPVSDSGKTFSNSNGSTTILLDELLCIGTESSLLNCSHAPLGMNDCNHKELAGVRCDVDPLIITTQPQDQINIVPGTDIPFTVVATGSDLNYLWLNGGRRLTDGSKYRGAMTATLTVIDVSDSDEGGYLCIVGNVIDTVLSVEAVLTTLDAPLILDDPDNVLVESGMDVTFRCTGEGSGNVSITWETSVVSVTLPNDTETTNGLQVTSTIMFTVSPHFHGNYSCIVTNERGYAISATAMLTVIEKEFTFTLKTSCIAISIISMVALIFTLITTTAFRKLRKQNASIFTMQHCIALFCMLLFFLVGIDRIENDFTCTIMSLTIQYFTMTSVFWIAAETVLTFQQLIMGFERASWKQILVPSLVCWSTLRLVPVKILENECSVFFPFCAKLLPLLSLAVAVVTIGMGDNNLISTDEGYCFFSQPGVMFGVFLGPLFSTVLFIVVMFILTTRVLLRHRRRKFFAGLLKTTTRTLVGAATVTVLFGLTWVFGAVAFTGGPDIFLWLFIFFNSLQGVFFCVFQKDAQDAWILLIRYGGKCSICRKRKEAAGENGTLKPTAGPAATFVSVPSVEFTVEERFDNGGILSLEGTLKNEAVGQNPTEANPAATFAFVPSVEFTVEDKLDTGGIISLEGTLKYEAVGQNPTEANPAATFASIPSVEFTVEDKLDTGGIISLEGTLKNEAMGQNPTEANPAATFASVPSVEFTVEDKLDTGGIISLEGTLNPKRHSISPTEEGRGECETSFFGQDTQALPQHRGVLDHEYIRKLSTQLIIPKEHLRLLSLIGDGEYGIVYKAQICTPEGAGSTTDTVAVKTLKGFFDEAAINDIMKESLKMKDFDHPNVLNMIGICIDGGPAPFIVMPFMANGSLRAYLKKERPNIIVPENADLCLTWNGRRRLVGMCIQIARGMEYLASRKLVHRDLASRNCMIDDNFAIKVADFGLSESIYAKTYFRLANHSKAKLPLKWMAPESLNDGIFTEKTDVWSFGVVCWEIFTGGKAPYAGVHPLALIAMLEDGHRLNKPLNAACSGEMYSIMCTCWHEDPANRPAFSDIVQTTSQIQQSLNRPPVLLLNAPMPSAEPIGSQVPSERQYMKNSGEQTFSEPLLRTLTRIPEEQRKQLATSAAKPNSPKDDYEEITSVYDQFPLPMPEKIKEAAVQSYEEIGGAVYDSFPVLACKDDTKSPVQLYLAKDITTKRECKTPSISALGDESKDIYTGAHLTNRKAPAIEHPPPHGRRGLAVRNNRKVLPYSRSNHQYVNIPTVIFVRGEFPVPSRLCTTVRTPKPVQSAKIPKGSIITPPHGSGHSCHNAPIVPPKPGVIAAANAGKPKRGTTELHLREASTTDNRGGKAVRHRHGVSMATNSPLEVFTKHNDHETISRAPYESAANYESISRDPYESVASPYESITASPYDTIVPPTASSFPLANHDDDREEDENTIGLNNDAPNDSVQPHETTTLANVEER